MVRKILTAVDLTLYRNDNRSNGSSMSTHLSAEVHERLWRTARWGQGEEVSTAFLEDCEYWQSTRRSWIQCRCSFCTEKPKKNIPSKQRTEMLSKLMVLSALVHAQRVRTPRKWTPALRPTNSQTALLPKTKTTLPPNNKETSSTMNWRPFHRLL